jgi:NADH dehydrogenase [ubiquinone] 1 alpha subcomplex assembly factor 1
MKSILLPFLFALAAAGCATCKTAPCAAGAADNFTLHQFSLDTGTAGWEIQDDAVMGGISKGRLVVNQAGNAVFTGTISLENDGGFSSFQRDFPSIDVSAHRSFCIGLKGDGKRYQIRVESTPRARHGYAFDFPTSGKWEVIKIPFDQMYAIRHGDRLDLPNYPGQTLVQFQILAGDGRAESFQLEIDRIWLK